MSAVTQCKAGRPRKSSVMDTPEQWTDIWERLVQEKMQQLWTFDSLADWLTKSHKSGQDKAAGYNKAINKRGAMRLFNRWGWLPQVNDKISLTTLHEATQKTCGIYWW